jgi:hypothetical protein
MMPRLFRATSAVTRLFSKDYLVCSGKGQSTADVKSVNECPKRTDLSLAETAGYREITVIVGVPTTSDQA